MKKNIKYLINFSFFICLLQITSPVFAFAEDLCFFESKHGRSKNTVFFRDCIKTPSICKSDQLSIQEKIKCKFISLAEIMTTQRRLDNRRLEGGRSLLHFDATYYLAQMIGYSASDAYQIGLYDQVSDTGTYFPRDQNGYFLLTEKELNACNENRLSSPKCLLVSPPLAGIGRRNFMTGGVLLHLGARSTDKPTPPEKYPTDYFKTPELERILVDLKEWTFTKKPSVCVAGITDQNHQCSASNGYVKGYMPFLITGRIEYIELNAKLGDLIIQYQTDASGNIIPESAIYSRQIDDYVKPHNGNFAKLGIFLHSLQDRYSHHQCYDMSYYKKEQDSLNYDIFYDHKYCDQGNHALWHSWEVGMKQKNITNTSNQTLEPALSATYDTLLEYAESHSISVRPNLNKQLIIQQLLMRLEINNANLRLKALVALFEEMGLQPLPGHGSV